MADVLYEKEGGVALITLNRPESLNAINESLGQELVRVLKEAARDPSVRAVVLTGAGRAFCAGADLKDQELAMEAGKISLGDLLRRRYNPTIELLTTMEKPVLAAVNGVAAGAGASLALACDLRVASEDARMLQAFVQAGLVPDSGATFFLTRMVGLSRAMAWAMTGQPVEAKELFHLGVYHRLVPKEKVLEEALSWAKELAQGPYSLGLIKRAVRRAAEGSLAFTLEYEAQLQEAAGRSPDHAEGVAAFREKRPPRFTGRGGG
ncbi:MAG: enoyl-CoA hydratase/isomerase family protein [Clostridiales bacterium]|nr:enoyl-CoA hydratase/isomerase family protein [Clostridiales bacterium]